jgi:hypothetical protein
LQVRETANLEPETSEYPLNPGSLACERFPMTAKQDEPILPPRLSSH